MLSISKSYAALPATQVMTVHCQPFTGEGLKKKKIWNKLISAISHRLYIKAGCGHHDITHWLVQHWVESFKTRVANIVTWPPTNNLNYLAKIIYSINFIFHWLRLKISSWIHKLFRKMLTEFTDHIRRIYSWTSIQYNFRNAPYWPLEGMQVWGKFFKRSQIFCARFGCVQMYMVINDN